MRSKDGVDIYRGKGKGEDVKRYPDVEPISLDDEVNKVIEIYI